MVTISILRRTQIALLSLALTGLLASCGQNPDQVQIVKDLQVQASTDANNDVILSMDIELALGNMSLPALELPILNPKTFESLGSLGLTPTLDGSNIISLDVNLSNATKDIIANGPATLPNGKPLPIGGIDQTKVLAIAAGNTGIKIYVGIAPGLLLVGVAVPIAQLDTLGGQVGGLNIFPTFNIKGVQGIGGLFTGASAGQSGLALFVDLSKVIDPSDILKGIQLPTAPVTLASASAARTVAKKAKLTFYPSSAGQDQMDAVVAKIYQLHTRKAKLTVR